jgi:ATP-dependent Clp protease adapter protein ClpS
VIVVGKAKTKTKQNKQTKKHKTKQTQRVSAQVLRINDDSSLTENLCHSL